ncbi:hypothetical protein V8Z74_14580 [Comamonas sp. w2-DMI]|uniref:hypothetical protein n=1 Tax=Comamonas sp. w2-DMI TaxID=3126391 RepID=UPI0032E4A683
MNTKIKYSALALACSVLMSACGGAGDENEAAKPEPTPPATGAVSNLGKDTFIMTAVDGDTFRIVFDRQHNIASISPLNTLFGVAETQNIPVKITDSALGITLYTSVNEDRSSGSPWFEIFTSPNGDEIVGQVDIADLKSNVIGTNLQINRTSELPISGAYNGVSIEAASAHASKKLTDFGIKNENGQLTYCDNGFYSNNVCSGTEYSASYGSSIFGGMARLMVNIDGRSINFAYLLLARNGAEYSLILDRVQNAKGEVVYGTGFAAPAKNFTLTSPVKSYLCVKHDATGGSFLTLRDDGSYTEAMYDAKLNPLGETAGSLAFNQAVGKYGIVIAPGIVSMIEGGGSLPANGGTKYPRGLNFSRNMMVLAQEGSQSLAVCRSDTLVMK